MINRLKTSVLKTSVVPTFLSAMCVVALCLYGGAQGGQGLAAKAYTPPAGSAERKAIMDALRGDQQVLFKVYYLKVHGDWAWADVTPLDKKGRAVAEGGASLLHKEIGMWKVMDLSVIPEDPDNPLGADDPTPKFVKAVQKAFPGVPVDIFPRPGRSK